MKAGLLAMAVGISLLFAFSPLAARPVAALPPPGLYAAYWQGTFFGSYLLPLGTYPTSCTTYTSSPAGVPSSTPPTATDTESKIAYGTSTGFQWVENGFSVGGTPFNDVAFSAEWTGYIHLDKGTTYYFQLDSDDGSWLFINTTPGSSTISAADQVIDNGGVHAPTAVTSGAVTVETSGDYPIEVDYYETCDSQSGIDLLWAQGSSSNFIIIGTIGTANPFTPAQIGSNAPYSGVPEFGIALPVVAAVSLLAVALLRKRAFGRVGTSA